MESNKNIQNKIDAVFESGNAIKDVRVSPFFKEKTLQRLFSEKEEKHVVFSWFSPKVQFATLACVIVLNVFAFTQLKKTTYNDNISQFAESYGITTTETSLFN